VDFDLAKARPMLKADRRDVDMRSFIVVTLAAAGVGVGLFAGGALAHDRPVVDRLAAKVVQKYQTSSCAQLAAEREHKPTGQREQMEERAVRLMHEDPQIREAFLNRVAAPIANKLFECGLIP
jgi:hypothetical protein